MNKKTGLMLFPWLLVLYEIAIYLSMDAYMPALPEITHVFGITASLAQLTATAWMLGGFLVQIIFGPLSDRYGRRPILLFGGVLYVISSIFCALAPNIHVMLIARLLQGIAMPSMFIAGYAAINEKYASEKAVHILALMNAVTVLAPAFGPILGGAFLMFMSWRWIFVILAIWAAITILLLFFKMPETAPLELRQQKMNIKKIGHQYWDVLTNFKFMNSALMTFLPIVGMIAWMLAGPFIVTRIFHHSTLDFGIMQAIIFGGFILGTKIVSKIATEPRYQRMVNIGLGISLLGSIVTVLFGYYLPNSLFCMIGAITVVTFGTGISLPILSRLTLDESDASMGVRVTIFSVIRNGSGVLGSVALAIFYSNTLLSMAMIIFIFAALTVLLRFFHRG